MREPAAPPLERILGRPEHGVRSITELAAPPAPYLPRGRDGRRGPSDRLGRRVHNRPVRVPRPDWEKVLTGSKRMYRSYSGTRMPSARLFPAAETFPRPVVLYAMRHNHQYDEALGVVTAYRQEPLGAIPAADLVAEGFAGDTTRAQTQAGMRAYRRYWCHRYKGRGWRPDDLISVIELRPWGPGDNVDQAAWLLEQLYGEWLDESPDLGDWG